MYGMPGEAALTNVNTHGGLLGFGAPWEVPAFYSIVSYTFFVKNTKISESDITVRVCTT